MLIEVVDCWLVMFTMSFEVTVFRAMSVLFNMCWSMEIVVLSTQVAMLTVLVAVSVRIFVIILVIGVLLLHTLVMVELVL